VALIYLNGYNVCRDYVAKQKEESNEVGKFSVRSLHKINEEVKSLSTSITTISSIVHRYFVKSYSSLI